MWNLLIALADGGVVPDVTADALKTKSPPDRDVALLRVAALFVPALIFSYGALMVIATLRVWGYIAYFFGVQLVWWGAWQTRRALARNL